MDKHPRDRKAGITSYYKDRLAAAKAAGFECVADWITAEYEETQSTRITAEALQTTPATINKWLTRLGYPKHGRGGNNNPKGKNQHERRT